MRNKTSWSLVCTPRVYCLGLEGHFAWLGLVPHANSQGLASEEVCTVVCVCPEVQGPSQPSHLSRLSGPRDALT